LKVNICALQKMDIPWSYPKQVIYTLNAWIKEKLIVMTRLSAKILMAEYQIAEDKIQVIAHGTHLIKP